MALVFAALLCNVLQVVVALSGQQLPSKAVGSLNVPSNHRHDTSATLDSNQPDCATIQPASLLQKLLHPWKGDYKTKESCLEIPVLHNTADPNSCRKVYLAFSCFQFIGLLIGLCLVMLGGKAALTVLLIPLIAAWWYIFQTGLLDDYKAGAMVWTRYSLTPAKGHNVSGECLGLVEGVYSWTIVYTFYSIMLMCFMMPLFVVYRMKLERQATKPFLDPADREFISSQEFRTKCVKAFRDADANHNGTLDLSELQLVLLFGLTDEEKKYVQESSLFKEAFEKCDADRSSSIDQEEFVEVMKFILTKAKLMTVTGRTGSKPATEP